MCYTGLMIVLHIPVGIPGCGKSSFVNAINCPYVVSTDAIRERIAGDANDQSRNGDVFTEYYDSIQANLMACRPYESVFADATNLEASSRAMLRTIAGVARARTHLILFRNPAQAITRNAQRERVVPDDVMLKMIEKYERAVVEIASESYDYVTEVSAVK